MKKNHCVIHGEMNENNAYKCKNPNGTIRLRCKECCHIRRAQTYLRDKDTITKRAADWKKENRTTINAQVREDRKNNPEKYRKWGKDHREKMGGLLIEKEVARRRNITLQEYYDMRDAQENKCALCFKSETRIISGNIARLCIDHCHKTNKVRSLLCHSCNTGLGKFKENIFLLEQAIKYLKKHSQEEQ